jgi:hypothetical protein
VVALAFAALPAAVLLGQQGAAAQALRPVLFPTPFLTPIGTPEPAGPNGQETGPRTVNVLLLPDAFSGDTRNNYNNTSVIWTGPVSPNGEHVQTRLLGRGDGMMAYLQVIHPRAAGAVVLQVNGRTFDVSYRTSPGWEWGQRCNGAGECRGWTAWRVIPWSELGGLPQVGDEWPLGQAAFGYRWGGVLRWGLPGYSGFGADVSHNEGAHLLSLPLTADAPVGGNSNCGSDDWPDYFSTWGLRNIDSPGGGALPVPLGTINQASSGQNQTDAADWPCYNKYYARFALDALPPGAQVISATVEVRHFGNSGYTAGYTPDGAQDTVLQIYEVDEWWDELGITWDNAPQPRENTGRLTIVPIDISCPSLLRCSVPYFLDVTEIVRRAQAAGRSWASFATYTGSGDYHSGKYIWTREGADQAPVVRIWYLPAAPAVSTPVETLQATHTATPQATQAATQAATQQATSTAGATSAAGGTPGVTPGVPPSVTASPTKAATPRPTASATPQPTAEESPTPPARGTVTPTARATAAATGQPALSAGLYLPEVCK